MAERVTVAAVQAGYVLMDREATLARVDRLTDEAAARGAELVVFPEVFVPGMPFWIHVAPIWEGDAEWYALLVDQAVVVPGPATERLAAAASRAGVYLVIGIDERDPNGATIYNTVLYFDPTGALLGKHRKLMPTGAERTVWGMGDGSTLGTYSTPFGRIGGLTCWENYMPLARYYMYAQGVDIWLAPTLDTDDVWIATLQHIARESGCYVVGVNPCLHVDWVPADFPNRHLLVAGEREWLEPGATAIVGPGGELMAGPATHEETTLVAELDLGRVRAERRMFDPVGHYDRPDLFRLAVDTRPRPLIAPLDPALERDDAPVRS